MKDTIIREAIDNERKRQKKSLEMIASENFVSDDVLAAAGSVLTNKYAEGYPGKRYYGGCEFVDVVENVARKRAKMMFNANYANVQPHSGSNANQAVFSSILNVGDPVLSMDLAHGGHLTHGASVNFSGKLYSFSHYGVDRETETLDYDSIEKIAKEVRPKLIIAGASAYSREIDFKRFKQIADEVGAFLLTDIAHIAGLVVAGEHNSPVPYADFVTTTTHKTLRGPRGGLIIMGRDAENTLNVVAKKSGRTKMWSELIDSAVMPGQQGGPLMHVIAAKAVAFGEALTEDFVDYQRRIKENAKELCRSLVDNGARVVSGDTENHLVLVDVFTSFNLTGKEAEELLDSVGITCNKNGIPFDTKSPLVTSGIRLGTPALTTRGANTEDMRKIGEAIARVLKNKEEKESVKKEIKNLIDEIVEAKKTNL